MALSISPEIERRVAEQISGGAYGSADEVLRAALDALATAEAAPQLDDETLDAIDESERQIKAGQVHKWEDVEGQVRTWFVGEK